MSTALCNYKKVELIRPSLLLQRQKFPQDVLYHEEFIKRLKVDKSKREILIMCLGLLGIQEMPPNQTLEEELKSSLLGFGFMDFRNVESHLGSSQYHHQFFHSRNF